MTRSSSNITAKVVCLPIDKPLDRVPSNVTAEVLCMYHGV